VCGTIDVASSVRVSEWHLVTPTVLTSSSGPDACAVSDFPGKRPERNVVAMAAGAAGEPAAAPVVANEEITEFVNALKQEVRA